MMVDIHYDRMLIVWSAAWGIACVLVIVIWLRSYWCPCCIVRVNSDVETRIAIAHGELVFCRDDFSKSIAAGSSPNAGWSYCNDYPQSDYKGFDYERNFAQLQFQTPIWLPMLLMGVLVIAPKVIASSLTRISWSFSLRTLLIATTLVATMLGLAIYAQK